MSIITTDTVQINGVVYDLSDGQVGKDRVFAELNYQVQHDANQIVRGDLSPALQNYEIPDFAGGMGLFIDNGVTFSRRAYYSTLDHQNIDMLTLSARRQAAGGAGLTFHQFISYNGVWYGLSSDGLYYYDTGTDTFTWAGTNHTHWYHGVVHKGYLFLAGRSNNMQRFDGTNFTTPAGNEKCNLLASLDNRLFAVEMVSTTPFQIVVQYSEDLGVTWRYAVVDATGSPVGLPGIGYDARSVCVPPPLADGQSYLYVGCIDAVWKIDYRIGRAYKVLDTSAALINGNNSVLNYWASTGKMYTNQRNVMLEIDLETHNATVVGPDFNVRQKGVPVGLPTGYKAIVWNCTASDPNFLYVGSYPISTDKAVVMGMDTAHRWYFFTTHSTVNLPITALGGADVDSGYKLFFGEQPNTGADPGARYLDFNADFSEEGEVHTPWLTMGLPDVKKTFYDLQVEASSLSADEKITIEYRVDFNEASGVVFSAITSADTAPYSRTFGTVPTAVGVSTRAIKFVIKFNRAAGSTTLTPFQYHMNVRWRPTSPPRYTYSMNLLFDRDANMYGEQSDLLGTLETALESLQALYFYPSGDTSATAINVIPVTKGLQEKFEESRRSGVLALKLLQIL